jgi:branched-chain amino acid transport system ATP-binding protein
MSNNGALLHISDLSIRFGGIVALDDVELDVASGEILGLIGPNGAGKTTVFNCISRFYTPQKGSILFDGTELLDLPADAVISAGVARTFQHAELFKTISVMENIMVGQHSDLALSPFGFLSYLLGGFRADRRIRQRALEVIDTLKLGEVASQPAGSLPFGTQKRVDIARALASNPRLLLLDEPAAGLSHEELEELASLIAFIRTELGVTILLVEHHMEMVMAISDRVCVLDFGRKIAHGTPDQVRNNPHVIEAYLGEQPDAQA